jgi:hypothetical protein
MAMHGRTMRIGNYLVISLLVITSIAGSGGTAIYDKYVHKTLKNANIYATFGTQKMFECEIICSEHGLKCKGANFYNHGPRNYVCELLAEVPAVITEEHLSHVKGSKLLLKKGLYDV